MYVFTELYDEATKWINHELIEQTDKESKR